MDQDRLVYVDEAAFYAEVAESTIRQWARRYPDAMPVRDRDWRGRTRYLLRDVLDVEWATRTGRRLTPAS